MVYRRGGQSGRRLKSDVRLEVGGVIVQCPGPTWWVHPETLLAPLQLHPRRLDVPTESTVQSFVEVVTSLVFSQDVIPYKRGNKTCVFLFSYNYTPVLIDLES